MLYKDAVQNQTKQYQTLRTKFVSLDKQQVSIGTDYEKKNKIKKFKKLKNKPFYLHHKAHPKICKIQSSHTQRKTTNEDKSLKSTLNTGEGINTECTF
jgi:hypothetical protein